MTVRKVSVKLKTSLLIRSIANIKDTIRILAYSARKIITNPTEPNSILKPETSSDSPSAKSKGVRLVSARQEINHIPTIGEKIIHFTQNIFIVAIIFKLRHTPINR